MVDSCLADGGVINATLARGGSLKAVNANGWGVLHQAARVLGSGQGRLLSSLLQAGGPTHLKTLQGLSPLHAAVVAGSSSGVTTLLHWDSALLSAVDGFGRTAFQVACLFAADAVHSGPTAWIRPTMETMEAKNPRLHCDIQAAEEPRTTFDAGHLNLPAAVSPQWTNPPFNYCIQIFSGLL